MEAKPLSLERDRVEALYYLLRDRQHLFSDTFKANLHELESFLRDPRVMAWELGDFSGLVWLIMEEPGAQGFMEYEPTARLHFFFWDNKLFSRPAPIREICVSAMLQAGISRLVAEFPERNCTSILFAERVGFRKIGCFRGRRVHQGVSQDTVLMDALPKDLFDEKRIRAKDQKAENRKRKGRKNRSSKPAKKPEMVPMFS